MDGINVRWSVYALLAAAGAACAQPYVSVPLGDLGGQYGAAARAVNDAYEVVGSSDTASGLQRAFYWSNGVMEGLPLLEGGTYSSANAINNLGQIVGIADDASNLPRAVLWTRGGQGWQVQDLGTLPGGTSAAANAISDTGYIVGRSGRTGGPQHAFVYHDGVMTDLGALNYPSGSGVSEALGVNDAGHVVGFAYAPLLGPDHAWYWDGSVQVDITPPGQFVFAHAVGINSQDEVAGAGVVPGGGTNGSESAVYSPGGSWTEIGIAPGYGDNEALGINDSGQIVGRMYSEELQAYAGFVYVHGSVQLLTAYVGLDGPYSEATGVSNSNGIAANFVDVFGVSQAFLIRPEVAVCYANCDRSTAAPILNANDFQCFLNLYAAGDPVANCDLSTADPVLNANDFQCFLNKFAAGCP